jgi:hypothetical protein
VSSAAPPWEKYKKRDDERPPWEKYQTAKEQPELGVERGKSTLGARPGQSFFQNMLESAGEMYTGDSESLPMQAKGAATAAGVTLPAIGLPVLAGSAGVVGAAARLASNPMVTAPVAAGMELYRSGSPAKAAWAGLLGGGGGLAAGKVLAKRALTLKQAEQAMRDSAAAKKTADEAKRISEAAAKMRTSTPVPAALPAASATSMRPGDVIPFPANPQQAAIAMRVSRPAVAPAPVPAPPAATVPGQGGGLESQLQQNLKTVKATGALPAPDRAALLNPANVEEKVVGWATEGGFTRAQIVKSLKEAGFNQDRGMASELVDLIFKKHGITRR